MENTQLQPMQKAIMVSVVHSNLATHSNAQQTLKNLQEMSELLKTLDIIVLDQIIQQRANLEASTLIGKGKWLEIKQVADEQAADILVFDGDLTPAQIKNIHNLTQYTVVDRTYVILEIFSHHAQSRMAKLQMNIARLEYLLPRLTTMWDHFSRQKGGVGVRGGEGEQQLELDRRLVRSRIELLKSQLSKAQMTLNQKKKKRAKYVSMAALVGYTNAGKSSLMNALTKSVVLVEDKLFATLDSTCKALSPNTHPPMVLMDTVGFISSLPASLFEGFRTTLESAMDAQLLCIVVDISGDDVQEHLNVTLKTLQDLNSENKKKLFIFNKKDKLTDLHQWRLLKHQYRPNILVSSFDSADMDLLRKTILDIFLKEQGRYDVFIPYENGEAHSVIKSRTNIVKQHSHERGIFYRVRVPREHFNILGLSPYLL